jgi:hypothetical protein
MKKSMIKVLVFFSIVGAVALILNYFLDAQMKRLKYEDASVWNEITNGGIDADILIMGSSRAATHIDPNAITQLSGASCYNLGMMGHNFFIEDARYNYYLKFNKAPKMIILSLDYESLQRRSDLFNHTQFLAYLDDSVIAGATRQYEGFSEYDYKLPLLKYVGEQTLIFSLFRNYFKPECNRPDRSKGFFARDFRWNKEVDITLDTLKPYTVEPDSLSVRAFEYFLEQCKRKGIQVVFVHTPVHPLGQAKVINSSQIIDMYYNFAKNNKYMLLDYAGDTMCGNKEYFMNSTHLNKYGAKFFTQKLVQDLTLRNLLPANDIEKK